MLNRRQRLQRHALAFRRHLTPRRLQNLIRVEFDLRRGAIATKGRPYIIFVDTCNVCNLRCPLCPSAGDDFKQRKEAMSFADFTGAFDQVAEYALEVNLHNWGEPLLNKDIGQMVAHAQKRNVGTNLSTNLARTTDAQLETLIESGLEYVVVSLDGIDAKTYEAYRVGGKFEIVMENLNKLVAARRRLKSKTPMIEWQFLVMKHNEHQMEEAKKIAAKIGVDLLRFSSIGLPFERLHDRVLSAPWMPTIAEYRELDPEHLNERGFFFNKPCHYLFRSITINPTGGVSPCCVVYDAKYDFGNLLDAPLSDFWNGPKYRAARALFGPGNGGRPDPTIPCYRCVIFKHEHSYLWEVTK